MAERLAGIDCGTNSVRLLIADADAGQLTEVSRRMTIVRLGQGVDRTGRLAPEALERTGAALRVYAALIAESGAGRVRMVATSATRDAANRDEFVRLVHDALGIEPEVISGAEEAQLSFTGAVDGLPGLTGELLLTDIGGGSTELVAGRPGGPLRSCSLDIGAVRLTERHFADDPPRPAQIAGAEADIRTALASARTEVPLTSAELIGVAGTVTTVAAIALRLERYDRSAGYGARVSAADVQAVTEMLLGADHDQRAAYPVIHPGRVDVIAAGALILRTLLAETGAQTLIASEHDILDGIVLRLAAGG